MAINNPPFDDSARKDRRKPTEDASNDTVVYDPYRQGVELTQAKQYAAGIVKILSEYDDHDGNREAKNMFLGQLTVAQVQQEVLYYTDQAKFDPAAHLRASKPRVGSQTGPHRSTLSLVSDGNMSSDGTVEPLQIRDVVSLRVHPKDVAHGTFGSLEEGNPTGRDRTDAWLHVVRRDQITVGSAPFEDESDTMGNLAISSTSLSDYRRTYGSYRDDQQHSGVMLSDDMPSDMRQYVTSMDPATENMMPPGYFAPGASGFTF